MLPLKSCRFNLFFSCLCLFIFPLSLGAQLPSALRGKWIGEVEFIGEKGTPVFGKIETGLGNFEAKSPDEIEFTVSKFDNNAGNVHQYLNVRFGETPTGGIAFTFEARLPVKTGVECSGTFSMSLWNIPDKLDMLVGEFRPGDGRCIDRALMVLFRKKTYNEFAKSDALRTNVKLIINSRFPNKATKAPGLGSDVIGIGSIHQGKVLRLADNPVRIEADKLYRYNDGYAVITKGSAHALLDAKGEVAIPFHKYEFQPMDFSGANPQPDYLIGMSWPKYGFVRGFAVVKDIQTKKLGVLNRDLKLVIPCIYDKISPPNYEHAFLASSTSINNGAQLYLDSNGKGTKIAANIKATFEGISFTPELGRQMGRNYEQVYVSSYGLSLVHGKSKQAASGAGNKIVGYVNDRGQFIIPPQYQDGHAFYEGLAAVSKQNEFGEVKWGFINTTGTPVVDFKFSNEPGDFHNALAMVEPVDKKEYQYAYIDQHGTPVITISNDDKCSYQPLSLTSLQSFGSSRAVYKAGHFHNGYALWQASCRQSNEGGVLVIDLFGHSYVLEDHLQRNGWPKHSFTPKSDFIDKMIVISSGQGGSREAVEAIANIYGHVLIRTPLGPDSSGTLECMFDPVSGLTSATLVIKNKQYTGYANMDGEMVIVKADNDKW